MAVTQSRDNRTIVAGADLSAKQFTFVKLDAAAKAVSCGDGEAAFGVLEVPAGSGKAATVTVSGKVMVKCGDDVTIGGPVAADVNGEAVDAAVGNIIVGTAYESGVDGQIIAIEISLADKALA
tara:strand:- start:352 stop:720 length:369 start_codon:yes stop_codon:yes gene_type:complete